MKKQSTGYNGNENLPKAGTRYALTSEQLAEYERCMESPAYFAETYFKIVTVDDGLQPIHLYDFQKEAANLYLETNKLMLATSRQIGKTTIATVIILHYVLFNEDKTVFILANKESTAIEVLERIQLAYEYLPHWLKSGVEEWNKTSVVFENRSKIRSAATSSDAIRGKSCVTGDTQVIIEINGTFGKYTRHVPIEKISDAIKFYNNIKIFNGHEFVKFDGVLNQGLSDIHLVTFDDATTIKVSKDHSFYSYDNKGFVSLSEIKPGHRVLSDKKTLYKTVKSIELLPFKEIVYDIDNAHNGNCYYTNGVISKNCAMLYIDECITGENQITIRNTKTSNISKVSIEKLFKEIGVTNNKRYQILTEYGFKDFFGIKQSNTNVLLEITFDNGNILRCTRNHKLVKDNNKVYAKNLRVGECLPYKKYKNEIVSIKEVSKLETVYDILEVEDNHTFLITNKNTIINSSNCAFIDNWAEFSASVLPVLSSGKKSKIILTSTPKGLNHFYEYYIGAKNGSNGFKLLEVKWNDVPGRDEEWRKEIMRILNGDEIRFDQEFCVGWHGTSDNLIDGTVLKNIKADAVGIQPVHIAPAYGYTMYNAPEHNHYYTITVDVSRGKGLDYSAFQVIDVTSIPYRQVAVFRNNMITPRDYATFIFQTAKQYNNAAVLIEVNDIGGQVADILYYDYEYDNILYTESAGSRGKRVSVRGGKNVDRGLRTTSTTKAIGCSMLKLMIEQRKLVLVDKDTLDELSTFSKSGKSYEAETGKHDDLVMGLVIFGWLSQDQYFKSLNDLDIMHSLRDLTDEQIYNELTPFGIISTFEDTTYEQQTINVNGFDYNIVQNEGWF